MYSLFNHSFSGPTPRNISKAVPRQTYTMQSTSQNFIFCLSLWNFVAFVLYQQKKSFYSLYTSIWRQVSKPLIKIAASCDSTKHSMNILFLFSFFFNFILFVFYFFFLFYLSCRSIFFLSHIVLYSHFVFLLFFFLLTIFFFIAIGS